MTKFSKTFLTHNGRRIGVRYHVGPWVAGVDPTTIKIYPRQGVLFPKSLWSDFPVENNSDMQTDYFEKDCIRITSNHPAYAQIKAVAA